MARGVQVQMPGYRPQQQQESTMDKILKGVQIANSVLNIGQGVKQMVTTSPQEEVQKEQAQLIQAQREELERKGRGVINPREALEMGLVQGKGKVDRADAQRITLPTVSGEEIQQTSYMKAPREVDPIEKEKLMKLETDRTFVPDKEKLNLLEKVKVTSDFSDILKDARKFQAYVGPQMKLVPDFMKQFIVSPEFASFTAKMDTAFFQFRKKITGAQAAEKELKDLKQTFPNAYDRMEYLIAKADTWKEDAKKEILGNIEANARRGRVFGYTDQMLDILAEKVKDPNVSKGERQAYMKVLEANNYQPDQTSGDVPVLLSEEDRNTTSPIGGITPSMKATTPQGEFNINNYLNKYGK